MLTVYCITLCVLASNSLHCADGAVKNLLTHSLFVSVSVCLSAFHIVCFFTAIQIKTDLKHFSADALDSNSIGNATQQ